MKGHNGDESTALSRAVRAALASPLATVGTDQAAFALVVAGRSEAEAWFRENADWALSVDAAAGAARLTKTRPDPPDRPHLTDRTNPRPLDPLRWTMVCLAAAHLCDRTHTTLTALEEQVLVDTSGGSMPAFDPSRRDHKLALIDAIRWLQGAGAVDVVVGDLSSWDGSRATDAVVRGDVTRIQQLIAGRVPPSLVTDEPSDTEAWIAALAPADVDLAALSDDERNRVLRVGVVRRLLDDPVLDLDDLPDAERAYLASSAGRDKVRQVLTRAGFDVEVHDGAWVVADPDGLATDDPFGLLPRSVVGQAALLLLGWLVEPAGDGTRTPVTLDARDVLGRLRDVMDANPSWASQYRGSDDGLDALCRDATDRLVAFGLARRRDGRVAGTTAAGRFGPPAVHDATTDTDPDADEVPDA